MCLHAFMNAGFLCQNNSIRHKIYFSEKQRYIPLNIDNNNKICLQSFISPKNKKERKRKITNLLFTLISAVIYYLIRY